jgi:hypothetical protein
LFKAELQIDVEPSNKIVDRLQEKVLNDTLYYTNLDDLLLIIDKEYGSDYSRNIDND